MKKEFWIHIVCCGANTAFAWYGLHGNRGAWNVFVFFAWLLTILFFLVAVSPEEGRPSRKCGYTKHVGMVSDLLLAALLAYFGSFGYASLQVVQMLLEQVAYKS